MTAPGQTPPLRPCSRHDRFGPRKRTWPDHLVMSQKCQNRKSGSFLFDHLVGARQHGISATLLITHLPGDGRRPTAASTSSDWHPASRFGRDSARPYPADAMCILVSNHLLTFAKLGLSAIDSVVADRCSTSMRVLTSSGAATSA